MKTISLGNEGLRVPAVGLGCMGMSDFYGENDTQTNLSVLDHALAIGCNFWDTADMYGPFLNEELLAQAMAGRRDRIILATKFGIKRDRSGEWLGIEGHPNYVKAACDASLKRLQTDYIDVYYQHRVDPNIPIEETVGAMANLVKAGKVRYLGLSEADPETIERAHKIHPISVLQTEYSLWSREVEEQILPTLDKLGIGFVAYSPLGRGFLTGKLTQRDDLQNGDWRLNNPRFQQDAMEQNRSLIRQINDIAIAKGVSTAQIALAWVLMQGQQIAAIPGTRHIDYLNQNWIAQDIILLESERKKLNQLSQLVVGSRY